MKPLEQWLPNIFRQYLIQQIKTCTSTPDTKEINGEILRLMLGYDPRVCIVLCPLPSFIHGNKSENFPRIS